MTPLQLSALWDAWKVRERASDRRAALMPWLYAESNRDRKQTARPFTIEDFMPSTEPQRVQSPEEVVEQQMLAMEQFRMLQDALIEQGTVRPNNA